MTKEERAEMLELMQEAMKPLQNDITELKTDVSSMNNRLDNLEKGQTKIEVTIENQVDRAIKTIGEGHLDLNRKLDEKIALENRVENVENRMSAVEYVLKKAE